MLDGGGDHAVLSFARGLGVVGLLGGSLVIGHGLLEGLDLDELLVELLLEGVALVLDVGDVELQAGDVALELLGGLVLGRVGVLVHLASLREVRLALVLASLHVLELAFHVVNLGVASLLAVHAELELVLNLAHRGLHLLGFRVGVGELLGGGLGGGRGVGDALANLAVEFEELVLESLDLVVEGVVLEAHLVLALVGLLALVELEAHLRVALGELLVAVLTGDDAAAVEAAHLHVSLALVGDLLLEPLELVLDRLLLGDDGVLILLALLELVLCGGIGGEGGDLRSEVGVGLLESSLVRLELGDLGVEPRALDGILRRVGNRLGGSGGSGLTLLAEPRGTARDVEFRVGLHGGPVVHGRSLRGDEVGLVPEGGEADVVGRTGEHGDAGEGGDADERQSGERILDPSTPRAVRALALDQRGELVQQRTRLGGAHHGCGVLITTRPGRTLGLFDSLPLTGGVSRAHAKRARVFTTSTEIRPIERDGLAFDKRSS